MYGTNSADENCSRRSLRAANIQYMYPYPCPKIGFMKIGRVGSTDHENTIEKSPKGGESLKLKHRFGGRF